MDIQDVVILSAVRTPIGAFGGVLKDIPAARLGAIAAPGHAGAGRCPRRRSG